MTWRDEIERVIRAVRESNLSLKVGFLILPLTQIFFLLSFSTSYWIVSTDVDHRRYVSWGSDVLYSHQGLWTHCEVKHCDTLTQCDQEECCYELSKIITDQHETYELDGPLYTTCGFMICGLLAQTLGVIYVLFNFIRGDAQGFNRFATEVACVTAAVCLLITIAYYGAHFPGSEWTAGYSLSWSYVCAVIAAVGDLVVAVLFLFDCCFCCCYSERLDCCDVDDD